MGEKITLLDGLRSVMEGGDYIPSDGGVVTAEHVALRGVFDYLIECGFKPKWGKHPSFIVEMPFSVVARLESRWWRVLMVDGGLVATDARINDFGSLVTSGSPRAGQFGLKDSIARFTFELANPDCFDQLVSVLQGPLPIPSCQEHVLPF